MTKVVRDKNTKKSLGYGFVKFSQEHYAAAATEQMNGFNLAHKMLKVSVARPPSLEIRNCKLYVTNLPKEFNEMEVISLFKEVRFIFRLSTSSFLIIFHFFFSFSSEKLLNAES
jgi:RNA recognition motif-containing protein